MMRAFQIACRQLAGLVEQEFPSPAKVATRNRASRRGVRRLANSKHSQRLF
jgi:hypothetical protein